MLKSVTSFPSVGLWNSHDWFRENTCVNNVEQDYLIPLINNLLKSFFASLCWKWNPGVLVQPSSRFIEFNWLMNYWFFLSDVFFWQSSTPRFRPFPSATFRIPSVGQAEGLEKFYHRKLDNKRKQATFAGWVNFSTWWLRFYSTSMPQLLEQ